ncbi:lysozyme inhibitor LprI family protein [Burkholderia perseverans]|uniref:lysozyme inhibitor LprI family protein n=1 Tax=Burkholderia perseverans TaxID=2615214 RepID=UPI001FEFA301|nr:lysozyme inhibitor LprI family protein [Burkholderia perseverans]
MEMRALSTLLGIAAVTLTLVANAQEEPCRNDGSGRDAAVCAHDDFVRADAQLNEAYQAALRMLSADSDRPGMRTALVAAQQQWIKFRDADCQVQDRIFSGGSLRDAIVLSCLKSVTEQRTKELKQISLP